MVKFVEGEVGFPEGFRGSQGEDTVWWLDWVMRDLTQASPERRKELVEQLQKVLPYGRKGIFDPDSYEGQKFFAALESAGRMTASIYPGCCDGQQALMACRDEANGFQATHLTFLLDENGKCLLLREISVGVGGLIINAHDFPNGNPRYDELLTAA